MGKGGKERGWEVGRDEGRREKERREEMGVGWGERCVCMWKIGCFVRGE